MPRADIGGAIEPFPFPNLVVCGAQPPHVVGLPRWGSAGDHRDHPADQRPRPVRWPYLYHVGLAALHVLLPAGQGQDGPPDRPPVWQDQGGNPPFLFLFLFSFFVFVYRTPFCFCLSYVQVSTNKGAKPVFRPWDAMACQTVSDDAVGGIRRRRFQGELQDNPLLRKTMMVRNRSSCIHQSAAGTRRYRHRFPLAAAPQRGRALPMVDHPSVSPPSCSSCCGRRGMAKP